MLHLVSPDALPPSQPEPFTVLFWCFFACALASVAWQIVRVAR